jgi:biopolymer transport protein ExbD
MKLKPDLGEDVEIDMSPMIDMVFLLLIFFLVAASVVKVEKVPVEIPQAVYAKVPENTTGRFEITVTEAGGIFVNTTPVTLDELKALLVPEIEANPDLKVMFRADAGVKYSVNEKVMAACAEAGANDLIFNAFEKDAFTR